MAVLAGNLTSVGNPFDFSLFFARQPEPDLEFTEEELDQTTSTRPITPMKMPKKSGGGRPLLWIILLALVGGAGYFAMEPEQLTEWLAPFLGEAPQQPAPPVAVQPKPVPQAPAAPPQPAPEAGEMAAAPPAPAAVTPPSAAMAPPSPPIAAMPAPAPPVAAVAPARVSASPLFAEGQKVTAVGNPTAPGENILLTLDAAGSKPGPSVRPGTTMSILDGDLQPSGWVYQVRTDDGVKGWISEKRLRLKF
jgi:hypothetical protein